MVVLEPALPLSELERLAQRGVVLLPRDEKVVLLVEDEPAYAVVRSRAGGSTPGPAKYLLGTYSLGGPA